MAAQPPVPLFRATSHLEALESGIMGDEHRLRRAQIRHRELDLEGRRVDARIASLESLATQATLLAGFSYAVLRPDSVGAILADDRLGNFFGILISFCTVASFCSALWVVYLTGYATIRARVTFLQGTRTRAVDATINMLIETQNQSRYYFDLSIGSIVIGAMAVVIKEAGFFAIPLLLVFVGFILNGAFYKRRIDSELGKWTSKELMPDNFSEECGQHVDRIEEYLMKAREYVYEKTEDARGKAARAVAPCVPCLADCIGGKDYARLGGVHHVTYSRAGRHAQAHPWNAASASSFENRAASGGRGVQRTASSAACSAWSPPPIVRSSSSQGPYPLAYRGWAYKTRSFVGSCRKYSHWRPTQKRYFVFSEEPAVRSSSGQGIAAPLPSPGRRGSLTLSPAAQAALLPLLRVFSHAEHADLFPAKMPTRSIDLSQYELVCDEEDYESERLGLQGHHGSPSWWLRCPDANSFRQLHNLLSAVTRSAPDTRDDAIILDPMDADGVGASRAEREDDATEEDEDTDWRDGHQSNPPPPASPPPPQSDALAEARDHCSDMEEGRASPNDNASVSPQGSRIKKLAWGSTRQLG